MTRLTRSSVTPNTYAQEPTGRSQLFDQTYVGFVKQVDDTERMGRLHVWIPELGGDPGDPAHWHVVNYCSPFAGATPIGQGDSQESYGMWFVPPDIDNEVVCLFLNGDQQRGIWIGCLFQQRMNHMTPGIPTAKSTKKGCKDTDPPTKEYDKRSSSKQQGGIGGALPTDLGGISNIGSNISSSVNNIGNQATGAINNFGAGVTAPVNQAPGSVGLPGITSGMSNPSGQSAKESEKPRPMFEPLDIGLKSQGLYSDNIRGPSDAGARRDVKSTVYGIKTPSGHHMVMDDKAENEYIRFRTKSGTQILIHDTQGMIYFITKNGNSWAELNDNGIDFYTTGSISMRCHKNYNLHVDGDYTLHVSGNMHTFVAKDKSDSIKGDCHLLNGKNFFHDVAEDYHSGIEGQRSVSIGLDDNLKITGKLALKSTGNIGISSDNRVMLKGKTGNYNNSQGPLPIEPQPAKGRKPKEKTDRKMEICEFPETDTESAVARLVTHEPFDRDKANQQESEPHETEGRDPPEDPTTTTELGDGVVPGTSVPAGEDPSATNGGTTYDLPKVNVNGVKVPGDVHDAIQKASDKYGVPYGDLMAIANVESGFKNHDKSSAGADGVFQFIPSTWKSYGQGKSVNDPYANADAAARLYLDNKKTLINHGISNPTATDIYTIHNLGPSNGLKLINAARNNPTAAVDSVIKPSFAYSNPLWYMKNGKPLTAGQSYEKLQRINAESVAFANKKST